MKEIKIEPIQPHHVQAARDIIIDNAFALQLVPSHTREQAQQELDLRKDLDDLNNIQELYFNNRGVFLVALDGAQVVGMGAIQYLDDEVCELRRMHIVKEYQGQGLGKFIAHNLLTMAKKLGYKKMRLWVYSPETQVAAVHLYKNLGFYEIPPYVHCKGKLFMEKIL
jgi:putative acetyltransferase